MLEIGFLRQSLGGVEQFAAADRSAPNTYIIGVFQLGEISKIAIGV